MPMRWGNVSPGGRLRRTRGYALPEVIVAMIIVTSAVLAMATTAARSGAIMNTAYARTDAMTKARVQVETLLAQPYAALSSGQSVGNGVAMTWSVTDGLRTKEIILVYRYGVPGSIRSDTLIAAARQQ